MHVGTICPHLLLQDVVTFAWVLSNSNLYILLHVSIVCDIYIVWYLCSYWHTYIGAVSLWNLLPTLKANFSRQRNILYCIYKMMSNSNPGFILCRPSSFWQNSSVDGHRGVWHQGIAADCLGHVDAGWSLHRLHDDLRNGKNSMLLQAQFDILTV